MPTPLFFKKRFFSLFTLSVLNVTCCVHSVANEKCDMNVSTVWGEENKLFHKEMESEKFKNGASFLENSVLASGNWYKYRVAQTGIYKLTFSELKNKGILSSSVSSSKIGIYGNAGRMLSEQNSVYRPDDLLQVPIELKDGGDGSFDSGDYILFYGEGVNEWGWNEGFQMYLPKNHLYDDFSYYYVTIENPQLPKRISIKGESQNTSGLNKISSYTYVDKHETDIENLIKSGRRIYGESFEYQEERSFSLTMPELENETSRVLVGLAGGDMSLSTSADLVINEDINDNYFFSSTGQYRKAHLVRRAYTVQNTPFILPVNISYNKASVNSNAWLDYIAVNANAKIRFSGSTSSYMFNSNTWVDSSVSIVFENSTANFSLWDITDHNNVQAHQLNGVNENSETRLERNGRNTIHLLAFRDGAHPAPDFIGKVENQNLHGLSGIQYVIVAPHIFQEQAETLAELHREEGLTVEVINPEKIYNEFSSGTRDITAIRDFMRMLYKKAGESTENKPRYLLLFGDGSYWNKDKENNTNVLPVYQSENSESETASYCMDDYFGFLDDDEGVNSKDHLDIGVGRFPVSTQQAASALVNKIERYMKSFENDGFGSWRNSIAFITDDQDGNGNPNEIIHMQHADEVSTTIENAHPEYLIDKIYLDAYKQETTQGGERYPQAKKAIKDRVQKGALIVNYTGHGGELGWAHERILDIPMINSWSNANSLPLFVTATCEFSRFDDPERVSAGEQVLLNPSGGGIALFSTTRLVTSGANRLLNLEFYRNAFPNLGEDLRLGDIIRKTKNGLSGTNSLNFTLLGDPALKLWYPKHKVVTTKVNGVSIDSLAVDTLKSLSRVFVQGEIHDYSGKLIDNFNGEVEVLVLDKAQEISTLDNDGAKRKFKYNEWNSIIYKGNSEVISGKFQFEFFVPRDINLSVGNGRFNYYAHDEEDDANGTFNGFLIGSTNNDTSIPIDSKGPDIDLFMNDEYFRSGGVTSSSPSLLAYLFDSSGVNTTGSGIGHDLMAIIDENTSNAIVLNENYIADLNSYQSGRIEYPLENLSEGEHTLTLKAWDNYNNPSKQTISFIVASSNQEVIQQLMNYPNPMRDKTTFRFEHNLGGQDLEVKISIYDIHGRIVNTIQEQFTHSGFRNIVEWDGKNSHGGNILPGQYVYSLEIFTSEGQSVESKSTLVVIK